jgi:hypothetical protein
MTPKGQNDNSQHQTFDLRRLPSPWKYIVALAIMAPIVWLAWHVGKNRPRPYWLEHRLIPFLAWCYIVLGAWWVIRRMVRWFRKNSAEPPDRDHK